MSDGESPVATLDLRLGDPAEAAEHGDDLIYYHSCPSGGTWRFTDRRWAAGNCGNCGYGKQSWYHQVFVCHACSTSTVCSMQLEEHYCDYC